MVDRPAEEWEWKDGKVTMGSAPLAPDEFIEEYLQAEAPADPGSGHVHLRVGDLEQARVFYAEALGFAVTAEAEGALFFAPGVDHQRVGEHTVINDPWGNTITLMAP